MPNELPKPTLLARLFAQVPLAIRAVALALATFSVAWGLASSAGLAAAMLGAIFGVVAGQLLAQSRFKLSFIAVGTLALFALGWGFARGCVAWEFVPRLLGPARTLGFVEIVRWAILPAAVCALLRSFAVRRPTLIGLELVVVAVAITSLFASHREGVISRPLWLADWAFRNDIDPARLILGVGFVAAIMLATLLLLENRSAAEAPAGTPGRRGGRPPSRNLRALSSLIVLLALSAIGILCISAVGMPRPHSEVESGRTDKQGDPPPPPPPPKDDGGGGGQPDKKEDSGGGAKPDEDKIDAGGAGAQPDGGGDGGGTPPPPPSQPRMTDDPSNSNSPAPVAVVIFADDYSPPSQAYYFRQEALSQWNGARLVATGRGDADRDGLATFPTEKTMVADPPALAGRVLVKTTVALLSEHTNPFGLESPVYFAPAGNPNPSRFLRAYKVESYAQKIDYKALLGRKSGDPKWSPELRAYYTSGPTDPRYLALANKYVEKLPEKLKKDPFALALTVKTHLDHDLTYSTKVHYAGGADPTAFFLFGDRIGYCVHFAHAAALLWRSLGIPARVSTGYHSEEDNRKGGSALVIKSGDAHMWPELYLEGIGWVVLDIAAEKNLDPPGQPQDEDLQRLLGDMARDTPPEPDQVAPPKPHHYGRDFGIAGLVLLGALAIVLYGTKIWRRLAPAFAAGPALPRIGYRTALDLLAEAGFVREIGETREAFADRVAEVAPSFREVTQMHVAARLRNPQTPPSGRPEQAKTFWKPALARLRAELSTRTKATTRLIGILNPASFFASR